MIQLLFILLLVPLGAGGLLLLFSGVSQQRSARWIALGGSLVALALSLQLAADYRALQAEQGVSASDSPIAPRVEYRRTWEIIGDTSTPGAAADAIKLEFHFGLDGISVVMIVLTALLGVVCVLSSWDAITERESEFYAALLILQSGVIGVFCAFDAVLFYVFFEFTLIPLFFLIAIWGGPQRRYAAVKFFLYTLAGSLVTLLGIITLIGYAAKGGLTSPCSLPELAAWYQAHPMDPWLQVGVFAALSVGFLIKVPVFPFHTWLPLAHVEAPTAGSILLAGVLLKLGTYGFLRFCLPMLPDACLTVGLPAAAILSVIGIVYGSLCALIQRDVKKLVAYSSVAHLGFCMLGLFALNVEGMTGGVLQMVNHGLSTGALFLIVGMFYERYHTRMMDDLGGLASRLPLMAAGMVFICMASVGLPGLNGFPGEMLSLAGMFKRNPLYAAAGATGLVLGAWYLLTMLQFVFFGPLKEPAVHHHDHDRHGPIRDISFRELAALLPLAAACLWIGVRPQPLIDVIRPDIEAVAKLYDGRPPVDLKALAVAKVQQRSGQEQ
ncbi:complex I subunit 4 family protein [Lacipirellula limnantheis]|uniref:NADH-quinone oxidoreductase subunit M n=1 Tax=Lacipirellula limnantheis TaxID=2528024 RepID=A0A517TVB0_9BACT|nr:NADH-quinone oxidoreductase subunit M [Lacipirellula limnantheis]QDT72313.1 NADH-quinone oxidoreductase subunit M [Lacipirellula limnantheis]